MLLLFSNSHSSFLTSFLLAHSFWSTTSLTVPSELSHHDTFTLPISLSSPFPSSSSSSHTLPHGCFYPPSNTFSSRAVASGRVGGAMVLPIFDEDNLFMTYYVTYWKHHCEKMAWGIEHEWCQRLKFHLLCETCGQVSCILAQWYPRGLLLLFFRSNDNTAQCV